MKKLFFLLSVLISVVCFGQTVPGYTPVNDRYIHEGLMPKGLASPATGDTALRAGQSKRAGQLMLDTTGADTGFYIRINNRMRKIALATDLDGIGEFGKVDTLSDNNRYFNLDSNRFLFKTPGTVRIGGKDSVGKRIDYTWSTSPLGSRWSSQGTAGTPGSGGFLINGSNTLTDSIKTGVENWSMEFSFVTKAKTSADQYILFSIVSDTLAGVTTRRFMFNLEDTAGWIGYITSSSGTIPTASNRGQIAFDWDDEDTLDCKIVYRRGSMTAFMKNRRNGQKPSLSYSTTDVGNVGTVQIATVGEFKHIGNFVYRVDEQTRPKFMLLDNSTGIGSGASNVNNRWWDKLFDDYADGTVMHSGAGERSVSAIGRIAEVVLINPEYVIWGYGVNDGNGGTLQELSAHARRFCDSMVVHGIDVIFLSLVPQSYNVDAANDTLESVANDYGFRFIDITTTLREGSGDTNKNSLYKPSADESHLNDIGQQQQADLVEEGISDLLTTRQSLVYDDYKRTSNAKGILVVDDKNEAAVAPIGRFNEYIQNKLAVNVIGDAQDADIFINGRVVLTGTGTANVDEFIYVGNSGSLSNPNFKIIAGTTTASTLVAGTFSSGNFSISTTPTFLGGNVIWQGNPVNMTSSPFVIMVQNPAGNGITAGLTVDNNTTNYTNATDEIQRWRKSASTVASVFRDGEFSTERFYRVKDLGADPSTPASGYGAYYVKADSAYFINDAGTVFNLSRDQTGGGGGMTNPMTTTGDIIYSSDNSGTPARLGVGSNGDVLTLAGGVPTWAAPSGGGAQLSAITAALGTNTINSGAFEQEWQWNSLAGTEGMHFSSTSTAAASNAQILLRASLSGANSNSNQSTYAAYVENAHTGTGSINYGLFTRAASGGTNYALYTDGMASVNAANIAGGATAHALMVRGLDNTAGNGIIVYPNINYGTSTSYGFAGMIASADFFVSVIGGDLQFNSAQTFVGGVTDPTAILHLAAGGTGAGTAPFKLSSGPFNSTGETGAIEYNGTNLTFVRTGTTRETIITANAVNSVSPTSPNRTITVVIDGTTYYIHAKTTND